MRIFANTDNGFDKKCVQDAVVNSAFDSFDDDHDADDAEGWRGRLAAWAAMRRCPFCSTELEGAEAAVWRPWGWTRSGSGARIQRLSSVELVLPEDITTPLLLVGAGLVAGTVNSIAGGGSLLTLPLLIFIGLPPTVANATNRIAIFFGGVGATHSFVRHGLIPYPWLKLALPTALIGVALGTWGASVVGDVAFERILAGLLVAAAVWLVLKPIEATGGDDVVPEPEGRTRHLVLLACFGIGLYSGFIQAGLGFIFLAIFSALGFNLIRANALKVALVLVFTTLSIALFWLAGMLDWGAGLTMAVGQFVGAKVGVHLQVLKGQAWVRNVLVVAIVAFALRLLFGG